MSDTPRTDALYFPFGRDSTSARDVSFMEGLAWAETLERELSAAQRQRDEIVKAAKDVVWYDWSDNDDDAVAAVERLRRSLPDDLREMDNG